MRCRDKNIIFEKSVYLITRKEYISIKTEYRHSELIDSMNISYLLYSFKRF